MVVQISIFYLFVNLFIFNNYFQLIVYCVVRMGSKVSKSRSTCAAFRPRLKLLSRSSHTYYFLSRLSVHRSQQRWESTQQSDYSTKNNFMKEKCFCYAYTESLVFDDGWNIGKRTFSVYRVVKLKSPKVLGAHILCTTDNQILKSIPRSLQNRNFWLYLIFIL